MINLVNVRKSFGELEVLKDINLQIHEKGNLWNHWTEWCW